MFIIMKVLLIITVCEACRPSVPAKKASNLLLPPPEPKHITINEGARVRIAWDPVKNNQKNPILGFKIKLWEQEKHKVYKFEDVNGTSVLIEEWKPVEKFNELPTHKPVFEAVLPPDAVEATFIVRVGEEYEIRGQSYNADGDGPLSSATGFKIHNE